MDDENEVAFGLPVAQAYSEPNAAIEREELPGTSPWNFEEVMMVLTVFLLYLSTGVAWGFQDDTIVLLLIKNNATPDQLALLSFDRYIFLGKIFFAPFMDAYFIQRLGERKTYIVLSQCLFGLIQFGASFAIEDMIANRSVFSILIMNLASHACLLINEIALNAWVLKSIQRHHMYAASAVYQLSHHIGRLIGYNLCILLHKTKSVSYTHLTLPTIYSV
eukprot:TRINITY_DN18029_c0_g1_i1.p1 TRINITY_DN18029_c0_g1~~TRINITY_DN18029_c0_g1_i1.p1  ORF type:complete len:219 (-),score=28.59 TRINITY_DN18029_c0_g1_i1:34-690(-)